mmetsp:Transcript_38277/g.108644  ORF Transcript_38277/g.108644 Transcript_38277/m.108644 type:complete len:233 (-) Transcript_38277:100-798(-)
MAMRSAPRFACAFVGLVTACAVRQRTLASGAEPHARMRIDHEKESAEIRSCATSNVLPQSLTFIPGEGGGRVTVSRSVACFMKIVQSMADDAEDEDEEAPTEGLEIPLPKVDADALNLIVYFAGGKVRQAGRALTDLRFSRVPLPLPVPLREATGVLEEDAALLDEVAKDTHRLFRLTNAANFVDCPMLLELCAARRCARRCDAERARAGARISVAPPGPPLGFYAPRAPAP